jgi:hypothetical protein
VRVGGGSEDFTMNNFKGELRLARKPNSNDTGCSVCRSENTVVVLHGTVNCHYCGNEIVLCQHCFDEMIHDLTQVIGSGFIVDAFLQIPTTSGRGLMMAYENSIAAHMPDIGAGIHEPQGETTHEQITDWQGNCLECGTRIPMEGGCCPKGCGWDESGEAVEIDMSQSIEFEIITDKDYPPVNLDSFERSPEAMAYVEKPTTKEIK